MFSQRGRRLALGMVALFVIPGAGIGVKRHKMKPRPTCGLPNYAYQQHDFSPKVTVLSQPALVLSSAATVQASEAPGPLTGGASVTEVEESVATRIKFFQLGVPALRVDHCVISRFSLMLTESGRWAVSLRADQNPQEPGAAPMGVPGESSLLQTGQLRRNRFYVAVRLIGPGAPPEQAIDLGLPVLKDLGTLQFMVERREPRDIRVVRTVATGAKAKNLFELAQRVEVVFYYDRKRASL